MILRIITYIYLMTLCKNNLITWLYENKDSSLMDYFIHKFSTSEDGNYETEQNFINRCAIVRKYVKSHFLPLKEDEKLLLVAHSRFSNYLPSAISKIKNWKKDGVKIKHAHFAHGSSNDFSVCP